VTGLKAGPGQPGGSRGAARFRQSLVTAQIALSTTLLVAAGLFIKSLANVARVDLGLRSDDLVTFTISPGQNGYDTQRSIELFERVEAELAAVPGVTDVTASMVAILAGSNWGSDVYVEGFERAPDTDANARYNRVGPGYFGALGVPLLAGREFTDADVLGAGKVAIVNEAFVEKFGLGRDAVGKRMGYDEELDTEIVGVVQDAKYSEVKDAVPPLFFHPYRQSDALGSLTFYARTGIDPAGVMQAIPAAIKRLDPNLPIEELKTLDQQVRENIFLDRMISTLTTAFGGLASLLAGIGLYGVLAYTVAQRTREIGLRMALGATTARVRRMVLAQVSRMMIVGVVIGMLGALAVGRVAETLLFGLQGNDPAVIALASLLLAAIALGAAYVPALRASRVEPVQALRYE
jgi:predicted permease